MIYSEEYKSGLACLLVGCDEFHHCYMYSNLSCSFLGLVGFKSPKNLYLTDLGEIEDKWNPTTTTTRKITAA